jgi:hypothetical protein
MVKVPELKQVLEMNHGAIFALEFRGIRWQTFDIGHETLD